MARWKLRTAKGLTLLSLFLFVPSPSHAGNLHGWFPKKKPDDRSKVAPCDCQFGFYGNVWRPFPDGCDSTGCTSHGVSQAVMPNYSEGIWSQPGPNSSWMPSNGQPIHSPSSAPTMPSFNSVPHAVPAPWSTYREFIPSQQPTPNDSAPRYGEPLIAPSQPLLPPTLPPSGIPTFAPPSSPSLTPQLPNPPKETLSPTVPAIPAPAASPSGPQATRPFVPPAPSTTNNWTRPNQNSVMPVGAWTRGEQLRCNAPVQSSVPRSLGEAVPSVKPSQTFRPRGPVMLLPPE